MKLIKDLGTIFIKECWVRFGIFLCPICLQEVKRRFTNGKIAESCGCGRKNNYKHGMEKTRLYSIWKNMKQRILNPNHKFYKDYGGRGITICDEWLDFIPFRDWALSNEYGEGLQINRIENDGNYELNNCNFVTAKENTRNRRNNIITLEIVNEIRELHKKGKYTQKELAKQYNITCQHISKIINNKIWGL